MDSPIIKIDDKHIPLYRIVWISDTPHFCGEDDCTREGYYEVRLDVDDSIWTNGIERDLALKALTSWCSDPRGGEESDAEPGQEEEEEEVPAHGWVEYETDASSRQ